MGFRDIECGTRQAVKALALSQTQSERHSSMKIKRGIDGGLYAVFGSNIQAEQLEWLFGTILRCPVSCFGQYDNAYRIW